MLTLIEKRRRSLSPAEQLVARWVLTQPESTLQLPIASIAAAANVSEPTVIRFTRSLGCSGLRDFKLRLAQSLADGRPRIHSNVNASDGFRERIHKIIDRGVNELLSTRNQLSTTAVEQAVASLKSSAQIIFYGVGASGVVARDAQHKFFRLGIPCAAYTDMPTILQSAAILGETSAVIAISKTGRNQELVQATRTARDSGATVITITAANALLEKSASIAIPLDSDEDTSVFTPMSSRLAQLIVLDILQVCLAVELGDQAASNLKSSKAILARDR